MSNQPLQCLIDIILVFGGNRITTHLSPFDRIQIPGEEGRLEWGEKGFKKEKEK